MSDSDEFEDSIAAFKEVNDEISRRKKNPDTAGMFVSGWDDDEEGIEAVKDPKNNPIDHVLWAAENGELETIKGLVASQPGLIHARDSDGYTPLHRAAYSNHVHIISFLLSMGAKVDVKTQLGWTPLHSACNWNNYLAAARLLAAGADVATSSEGDQTPLHLISSVSHAKSTLLVVLLRDEAIEVVNKPNKSGETPIHLALGHGIYGPLFEMAAPSARQIKSLAFTYNPFVRYELNLTPQVAVIPKS